MTEGTSHAGPTFYNDGQIRRLFPYCHAPDCLIIGGPADGNEGQTFKEQYPTALVIGVEPNRLMCEFQFANKFPGPIYPLALWSENNVRLEFTVPVDNRCGSLVNYRSVDGVFRRGIVDTITIDTILSEYPDRKDVVVWIDIEGAEDSTIIGAERSMREGIIKLWNVEVNNTNKHHIIELLCGYGYDVVEECDIRHMNNGRVISDLIFSL